MVNIDIIVSVGIFAVCFAFFIYGKIHRSIVALVGACSMVIFGSIRGFYTQHQALEAIDFDTLGLLFGMMSIVAILKRTGFFRYIAIKGTRMAKGNPWKMLVALSLTTGFLSMIIDNVTTILLITPVSLLVSDILGINPLPILIGEVTMSNIGGFATLVGDPPNIMIASASSFGFNDFVIHLMPISLLCMFVNLMLLKALSSSLPEWKEKRLQKAMQMSEKGVIKEKITLIKCIFSLVVVVILFVTEEFHNLKPSFVAIIGAVITLMLVGSDPREVFSQIEWTVLLFFAGLFVLVEGVDRAGFLKILSNNILNFLGGDIILTLFIIWSSFILSSVIDNIPYTAAMIPVIKHMANLGINISPLWWSLAVGVALGGNGTPIGSSAGVVVMELTEKTKHPLTFKKWFIYATLPAICTTGVASLAMILEGIFFS